MSYPGDCPDCSDTLFNWGAMSRGDGDIYDEWGCENYRGGCGGAKYEVHASYCKCGCGGGAVHRVNDQNEPSFIPDLPEGE